MSRVDEERDAARAAQRLAEAKRTEQVKKSAAANAEVGFSKLVAKQKTDQLVRTQQNTKQESTAKSAIAQLLKDAESAVVQEHLDSHNEEGRRQEATQHSKASAQTRQTAAGAASRNDGRLQAKAHASSTEEQNVATQAKVAEMGTGAQTSEGRKSDAKLAREMLAERGASSDAQSDGHDSASAAGARGEKGDLKADADKGGGSQQGGKDGGKDGQPPPTMRFNPALMAPVGIAKPKEATGSDRLRKVANELAQKIVERVRIGTNAAGKVEFQIDLKSDVLSGLAVKVSSQNGKIRATFTGTNKDVLKLVEEQGDALKAALAARGLTLEDFKVERRA